MLLQELVSYCLPLLLNYTWLDLETTSHSYYTLFWGPSVVRVSRHRNVNRIWWAIVTAARGLLTKWLVCAPQCLVTSFSFSKVPELKLSIASLIMLSAFNFRFWLTAIVDKFYTSPGVHRMYFTNSLLLYSWVSIRFTWLHKLVQDQKVATESHISVNKPYSSCQRQATGLIRLCAVETATCRAFFRILQAQEVKNIYRGIYIVCCVMTAELGKVAEI